MDDISIFDTPWPLTNQSSRVAGQIEKYEVEE
jgi:hypothetical protein